jgi:hypothetical protein
MLELKPRQREVLIDKLPDVANLAAGALVFGQFIGGQAFSPSAALSGIALWFFLMACTLSLAKGGRR